VRKYITSADSTLVDSTNTGREELQAAVASGLEDPASLDPEVLRRVADESQKYYLDALRNEEVPPEFEDAHHYIVTALGIRAQATDDLAQAASGNGDGFKEELATAVADYKTSDTIIANFYLPAVKRSLETAGQTADQAYLQEPQSFMDYGTLGFDAAPASNSTSSDPDALHGVQVASVKVAGKPLYRGGDVVLTGSDEPTFAVRVTNGGEVPETGIDVEVILNTAAERQAKGKTIARLEPKKTTTVEVGGFIPGELDERARVTVEAGPVEYEKSTANNTLTGTVKFGM
jgi:hypothetical protein